MFINNNDSSGVKIYSSTDKIVDLRLNENKQYEIMFGDGFNGAIPPKNSNIYIVYLTTNGPGGKISAGDASNKSLHYGSTILGVSRDFYSKLTLVEDSSACIPLTVRWSNTANSTTYVKEESVEDIRRHAPEWFKIGNRLVTT
jgi:hypothetical protein